jgi:nucleoside-diphosphate-sugar epimerase
MRVFIAGATGTLGRPVVRALVSRGHQVVGLTRTDEGARRIQATGAKAVIGNALDAERMKKLVVEARPDVVVHLLTAIPPAGVMRKNQLRPTNELRVTGTANLIGASMAAGARRLVAESFVGIYAGGNFSRPASGTIRCRQRRTDRSKILSWHCDRSRTSFATPRHSRA